MEAAAVKKLALSPANAKVFVAWTNFLDKGEQTWSRTPAPSFSPAIRSTIWQVLKTDSQAQSLNNPMIDYLLWRRSLDPQRFLLNHPSLSPALAQLLNAPALPVTPPTPTAIAPQTVSGPPAPIASSSTLPPPVPEPNSLLLAATMTVVGLFCRHRLARAHQG
ncbi:MAG: hypothetical protein ACP5XB_19345 [Isosphaeraceae bacterium]